MRTSLHQLEKLIRLLPVQHASDIKAMTISEIQGLLDQALKGKDLVLKEMLDTGINAGEEKALQVVVRCYQDGLITLSDGVYSLRQASVPAQTPLYDPLLAALAELLLFLKENFGPYINPERKIPNVDRDRLQRELKLEWSKLLNQLSIPGDKPYQTILNQWMLMVADVRYSPCLNDRQYTYARILLNELKDRISDEPGAEWNEEYSFFTPLVDVLVYMNFNHPALPRNVIARWKQALSRLKPDQHPIVHLEHWRFLLNRMSVQKCFALYVDKPSLRDQLEQWLITQIAGMAIRKDVRPLPPLGADPEPKPYRLDDGTVGTYTIDEAYSAYKASVAVAAQTGKMELNISVPMLAVFVKLLMEHQIINVTKQSEAIRFFATHFCTRRQPNISTGSLYGSFHKPNALLLSMLRRCLRSWDRKVLEWGKEGR